MIETQPVPEHIAAAVDVLRRVDLDDPDLDGCLRLGLAASTLLAVVPPYPPMPEPTGGALPVAEARARAEVALGRAIDAAGSAEEAVRCAAALDAMDGEMVDLPW